MQTASPLARALLLAFGAAACSPDAAPAPREAQAVARPRPGDDRRCDQVDSAGACTLYGVSMIDLIARPAEYHGKRVRVIGFVRLEFEGNGIYLHEEDWRRSITRNGLWIEPPDSLVGPDPDFEPGYMIVEGTFNADNPGHLSMWSGAIEDVVRLQRWDHPPGRPKPEEPRP